MKNLLLTLAAIVLFSGCATHRVAKSDPANSDEDARMARGLTDSMLSATHRFPSNVPR